MNIEEGKSYIHLFFKIILVQTEGNIEEGKSHIHLFLKIILVQFEENILVISVFP